MSEPVQIVLFPAVSAILVALITLLRQILRDRREEKSGSIEQQLGTNSDLLLEYRNLIKVFRVDAEDARAETEQVRAELTAVRATLRDTAEDRDRWREAAAKNARRIAESLEWLEERKHDDHHRRTDD